LKKEIEKDTRRWNTFPCSWISRINIVKMAIHTLNVILIKIPMSFFAEVGKSILQLIQKHRIPQIAKTILSIKEQCWRYLNTWL
jgi:hypothetical protein